MTESDGLIASALLGDEAKKFKESDFGKCLIGMANQEADLALAALATVKPTDVQAIERLQNRVWLGRHFEEFVDELLTSGENALALWSQKNNESQN